MAHFVASALLRNVMAHFVAELMWSRTVPIQATVHVSHCPIEGFFEPAQESWVRPSPEAFSFVFTYSEKC